MSHNIKTRDYPENVNKRSVQDEWDHYAAMEDWQEGCSGVSPIRWLENEICDSYEEAEDRIEKLDRGWYDCLAVKYRETEPVRTSKARETAGKRVNQAQEHYNNLKKKVNDDFFACTSEFVGCKECGSKLARKRLNKPTCPLCGRNLLSETATTRLMNAHDKIIEAQERQQECIKADEKRAKKTGKLRWLVKVEYHT